MSFNRHIALLTICLVVLACSLPLRAVETLVVAIFDDQLAYLEQMIADDPCPAFEVAKHGENQMLLEYLFVCHALKIAYKPVQLSHIGLPVAHRVSREIADGKADISGFGVWSQEGNHSALLQSEPLLRKSEFSKGLYTLASTRSKLDSMFSPDISSLIAVSNKNWTYDWAQLRCSGMNVIHVNQYKQMFKVLDMGRADVLALAFGKSQTLEREEFGIKLYPIPNMRLVVPDSSHILVGSHHADAKLLLDAINQGIVTLRRSGILERELIQTGVIKPKVQNWDSICPHS